MLGLVLLVQVLEVAFDVTHQVPQNGRVRLGGSQWEVRVFQVNGQSHDYVFERVVVVSGNSVARVQ